jgi:hypothetical protein
MSALLPNQQRAVNRLFVAALVRDASQAWGYVSTMVTRIGPRRPRRLYVKEWMDFKGLSDEQVGNRLDRARETIWRWRTEQHRLNPEKLAELASALDIEPQDFYRPPQRPSLDAIVESAPDDLRNTAIDIVRRLVGKAS